MRLCFGTQPIRWPNNAGHEDERRGGMEHCSNVTGMVRLWLYPLLAWRNRSNWIKPDQEPICSTGITDSPSAIEPRHPCSTHLVTTCPELTLPWRWRKGRACDAKVLQRLNVINYEEQEKADPNGFWRSRITFKWVPWLCSCSEL
jgi:hypothetical protein